MTIKETYKCVFEYIQTALQSMTNQQAVAFFHGVLLDYQQHQATTPYEDSDVLAAMNHTSTSSFSRQHYTDGRCNLYLHDFHVLMIASLVLCKEGIPQQAVYDLCNQYSGVLTCILHNSLRKLACYYIIHAIGGIRYSEWHMQVASLEILYTSMSNTIDSDLFAIQLAARTLNPNEVVKEMILYFGDELAIGMGPEDASLSVGKTQMMSYWISCLLSVLYARNMINHDQNVGIKAREGMTMKLNEHSRSRRQLNVE